MPNEIGERQQRLADAVRSVYGKHRREIEKAKRAARKTGEAPEWIWEGLVGSAATWGSIRGIKLLECPELHELVRWRTLARLDKSKLRGQLHRALKAAGVRMYERKVGYLLRNFRLLESMGGPRKAQRDLGSLQTGKRRWTSSISSGASARSTQGT